MNNIKFTQIVKKSDSFLNNCYTKQYCINGIVCCNVEAYHEYFCSIKNYTPSNIRDVVKTAKKTTWSHNGLKQIFGDDTKSFNVENIHPDLTYGYVGKAISFAEFKRIINEFIKVNNL